MHNSLVIFIIKILRFFRSPGTLATSPAGAGLPESKGDWMLKVLIGNFLIKVIKRGKCDCLENFLCGLQKVVFNTKGYSVHREKQGFNE
jgi:hypothetical protein